MSSDWTTERHLPIVEARPVEGLDEKDFLLNSGQAPDQAVRSAEKLRNVPRRYVAKEKRRRPSFRRSANPEQLQKHT